MSWEVRERNRLRLIREYEASLVLSKTDRIEKQNRVAFMREEGFDLNSGQVRGFTRWRPHAGHIRSFEGHNLRVYCADVTEDDKFMVTGKWWVDLPKY